MRPVTPTTSAVCFNNRGPMYTMRRNFSTGGNGQHRGPYSKRTCPKTPAVAKGPFFRDVVLLVGQNSDSVPRQTNKVWLSENGHILTACCLQKEWTAEEVAHNLRSLFGTKIPGHSDIQVLASVHTKLLPPTLAPGQVLDGVVMHRLFKTKPVYLKPSVQIIESAPKTVLDDFKEDSDDDFPPMYEATHTYVMSDLEQNTLESENDVSMPPCVEPTPKPTPVIDLTEEYNALFNEPSPFEPLAEPEVLVQSTANESTSDETSPAEVLREALSQLSSDLTYDNISKFNVSRNHLWESARRGCSKKSFSPKNKISVKFTDDIGVSEGAVDLGGPTREFLSLLIKHINRSSMFIGDDGNKFITCLSKNLLTGDYCLAGKVVAMSLVHGGPGPESFSSILFNSIATNPRSIDVKITDVYDEKLANSFVS